jgi:hypothetical protein
LIVTRLGDDQVDGARRTLEWISQRANPQLGIERDGGERLEKEEYRVTGVDSSAHRLGERSQRDARIGRSADHTRDPKGAVQTRESGGDPSRPVPSDQRHGNADNRSAQQHHTQSRDREMIKQRSRDGV